MPAKSNNGKGVALAKRAKIDKAQQYMLIAVCAASVFLGVTIVGVIYLSKKIGFNVTIMKENGDVIDSLDKSQKNLKSLSDVVGELASNDNLESVARKRDGVNCEEGIRKAKADDGSYALQAEDVDIEIVRTCSALRVIADTLPSKKNTNATNNSLNWLVVNKNKEVKLQSLNGTDSYSAMGGITTITDDEGNQINVNGLGTSITIEDTATNVLAVMDTIEHSIRNFDIRTVTIGWSGDGSDSRAGSIDLSATYASYYSQEVKVLTQKKTICANDESKVCLRKTGGSSK